MRRLSLVLLTGLVLALVPIPSHAYNAAPPPGPADGVMCSANGQVGTVHVDATGTPGCFLNQHVTPQFDAACGWPGDIDGVPNNDGYWQSPAVWVLGGDNNLHRIGLDLAAYRLTENGNCYRGFYASTWFFDHAFGNQLPRVNAYTGYNGGGSTRGPWTFNHGTSWDWGNATWTYTPSNTCETCSQLGPWGSYTAAVTLPNGWFVPMDFGISTGYGRRANTTSSHVFDQACPGPAGPPPACNFDITSYNGQPNGWWVQIWE